MGEEGPHCASLTLYLLLAKPDICMKSFAFYLVGAFKFLLFKKKQILNRHLPIENME